MKIAFSLLLCFFSLFTYAQPNVTEKTSSAEMQDKAEIAPTEDLMREHGVLNRLLLIYEEIIHRIDSGTPFPVAALERSTKIMQSFIENYHEKLEEEYIFPIFEKNKQQLQLIKTLRNQHIKGRSVTNKIRTMLQHQQYIGPRHKRIIKNLLHSFIRMYRPHEAREDTVLFPQVRSLLSEREFKQLGELFENREQKLFGPKGFEHVVQEVAAIEKDLGIYILEQFTPKTMKPHAL